MPYSLTERLGPHHRQDLSVTIDEETAWWKVAGVVSAGVVVTIGAVTFVGAVGHVDQPLVLALLLAAAAAPWVVQLFVPINAIVFALWPLAALAALNLLGSPLGTYDFAGHSQFSMLMLVWMMGACASVAARRDIVITLVGSIAIMLGRQFTDDRYGGAHIWVVGLLIAFLAGLFIRSLAVALLNTKLAESAVKEQAATEERQRIAREVHDVIAHSMTVTMLHLTAARLAVNRGDALAATEALEEAERAGRTSLSEIRSTVGLLRTADAEPVAAPQPGAPDVPGLVAGYRSAGVPVELTIDGDLTHVDAATGLALFRIVQESLTNAGRHAPGSACVVDVHVGPPLRVDVKSTGGTSTRASGDGMGISGMTERASALGGSLVAGPDREGWRVTASIP